MAYGSFIVGGGTIPRIGDIVFTTVKDNSPAKRYKNTVWELVAQNRVPMGAGDGHEGGETVEAGLPSLYGQINGMVFTSATPNQVGTLEITSSSGYALGSLNSSGTKLYSANLRFLSPAKTANTVQPPAYYFYFWRRVS